MRWKSFFAVAIPSLILAAVAVAENQKSESQMTETSLKAVVHVNFDDPERLEHGLGNVENVLKDVPDATINVVCHGAGIALLHRQKSAHVEKVRALMERGVEFSACENTMQKKSITRDELLAGVETVPSGAVQILRRQQNGYSYFRP